MAEKTRTELDAYFETGDTPTEVQFQNLIDSVPNLQDDIDSYGIENDITAHAGGGQANAYQLTKKINVVIVCVNNNDSIKLPAGEKARIYIVINKTANTTTIYPPVGGFINNWAVNVGSNIAPNNIRSYTNYDNNKWWEFS